MSRRVARVQVFGPAYLDRVVLIDRPLASSGRPPLDQSVNGALTFGPELVFRDQCGATITVDPPPKWPGPTGLIDLSSTLGIENREVRGLSWHDDLGGMGAGFASALEGELVSALGPEDDPMSQSVNALLERYGVRHRPIRVASRSADWTLLLISGPFGDKLPVGFRGCHDAVESLEEVLRDRGECDLRVVAALPNLLAAQALRGPGPTIRLFAPSTRNMTDRATPVRTFVEWIDILCCNRREWESLEDREHVAWQVSILAVTDGPAGSIVRFTTPQGEAGRIELPSFPRSHPPRDTNRAGEAFAANLVETLRKGGWSSGVADDSLVRSAAERASAAAALVLDSARFGFPTAKEIDAVLRAGRVSGPDAGDELDPRYNAGGGGGSR